MSARIARTMRALGEAFDAGRFVAPVVAAHFPRERAREAYEAVAAATHGRVAINLG
ncbi:hypothetical protein [Paraburkholderia sacchari]|uniref:Uncharacterized protein n=1 Tax=Paraburkholderia sacchari TaxID=159450 RepID=A0A8T6ZBD5_9BURK|nr:hypothetical protein [Paraburkholderia sacchari]NLP61610.1 hypothetical protein [Paraburkholderia sacchari]